MPVEEDLQILDHKLNQLRLDYERYFLGSRPRAPLMLRAEGQKTVLIYSNTSIQNTAQERATMRINGTSIWTA